MRLPFRQMLRPRPMRYEVEDKPAHAPVLYNHRNLRRAIRSRSAVVTISARSTMARAPASCHISSPLSWTKMRIAGRHIGEGVNIKPRQRHRHPRVSSRHRVMRPKSPMLELREESAVDGVIHARSSASPSLMAGGRFSGVTDDF